MTLLTLHRQAPRETLPRRARRAAALPALVVGLLAAVALYGVGALSLVLAVASALR